MSSLQIEHKVTSEWCLCKLYATGNNATSSPARGDEVKVKGVLDWAGLMSALFTQPHEDMGVRHSADVWFVAMADPRCDDFLLAFWGVLGFIVCVLGILGNFLAFVIFQRHYEPIRTPAQTLIQALCISDCCLLALVLMLDCASYACDYFKSSDNALGGCVNPWVSWPYIRYIWVLTPVSHMCTAWFVVLIAANRYWAVCKAFDVDRIWTNQRTTRAILFVIVSVLTFNLPRWFEYRVVSVIENEAGLANATAKTRLREERSDVSRTFAYLIGYKMLLVNLVLILAPLCLVATLTSLIIHRLYVNSQRPSTPTTRRSSAARITRVLTAVVAVHVVCQTPLAVFNFARYVHYGCGEAVFYLDHISKLLINLNSCLNVILYCAFSAKFRQSLCTLVCASQCRSGKYVSTVDLQQLRHHLRHRHNDVLTEAVPLRSSVQRRAGDEVDDVILAVNHDFIQGESG